MNYRDLSPSIRRGIKTIIEYWEKIDKDAEIDDDANMDAGILQLIEDTCNDREDYACEIDNLCNVFFERIGYNYNRARIIKEKLINLTFSEELDYEYVVKLLKEFDLVNCCLADLSQYPLELVESLYAIAQLEKHDDITQELIEDIYYIRSIYRGCPHFYVFKKLLNDLSYDYKKNNFLAPVEREKIIAKKYVDNFGVDDETKYNPEIYGCMVKVRFQNGKVYRYNCRFDEIEENDVVLVTGKMQGVKGTVVERLEIWNTADYMEEVLMILN